MPLYKVFFLCVFVLFSVSAVVAQAVPSITFSTKKIGEEVAIRIATAQLSTYRVDRGDGVILTSGVDFSGVSISFIAKGEVKIYAKNIIEFECNSEKLTLLNIDSCTSLEKLSCMNNELRSLNVTFNDKLKELNVNQNSLESLYLANNFFLETLKCAGNKLTSIDINQNENLIVFDCSNNQIRKMYVDRERTEFKNFNCSNNSLSISTLPVFKTVPQGFDYSFQSTISGNLTQNNLMIGQQLDLHSEYAIDNFGDTVFTSFVWRTDDEIPKVLVEGIDYIEDEGRFIFKKLYNTVICEMTNSLFPDEKFFSINISLKLPLAITIKKKIGENLAFSLQEANDMSIQIDWGDGTMVQYASHSYNERGISQKVYGDVKIYANDIVMFDCANQDIYELNVSNAFNLQYLTCSNNDLSELDVLNNSRLVRLLCSNNKLDTLILDNPNLIIVDCSDNRLRKLHISENMAVKQLDCSSNHLLLSELQPRLNVFDEIDGRKYFDGYRFANQTDVCLNVGELKNISTQYWVDLSAEAMCMSISNVNVPTEFTWHTDKGELLTLGVDYEKSINGKFRFLKYSPDSVYCRMTNDAYEGLVVLSEKIVVCNAVADFVVESGCSPLKTTILNNSKGAVKYVWNFGDGSDELIVTDKINPEHTFYSDKAMDYKMSLEVFSSENCSNKVIKTVSVLPSPKIKYTDYVDYDTLEYYLNETVYMDNQTDTNGIEVASWKWFWKGATIETRNFSYKNNNTVEDGWLKLEVSYENGCAAADSSHLFFVNVPSVSMFSETNSFNICGGDSLRLYVVATNSDLKQINKMKDKFNVNWYLNERSYNVEGDDMYSVYVSKDGSYYAELTHKFDKNIQTVRTTANEVTVEKEIMPVIKLYRNGRNIPFSGVGDTGKEIICPENDTVRYSLMSNVENAHSYVWLLNSVDTVALEPEIEIRKSGKYSFKIETEACKYTVVPKAVEYRNADDLGERPLIWTENYSSGQCQGEVIRLVVDNADFSYINDYQWFLTTSDNQNDQSKEVTAPVGYGEELKGRLEGGRYTVIADIEENCRLSSLPIELNFKEQTSKKPDIVVKGPANWFLLCNNPYALEYKWFFNDQIIVGADRYYFDVKDTGNYVVAVRTSGECFAYSETHAIPDENLIKNIPLSVDYDFSTMSVLPNPARDFLFINVNSQIIGKGIIRIADLGGKYIYSDEIYKSSQHYAYRLALDAIVKGVYVLHLNIGEYHYAQEFIVQ